MEKSKRTYKIAKRAKYENDTKEVKKDIIYKTIIFGSTLLASICMLVTSKLENNTSFSAIEKIIGSLLAGLSAVELKALIKEVRYRVFLEDDLNRVNKEIEEENIELIRKK